MKSILFLACCVLVAHLAPAQSTPVSASAPSPLTDKPASGGAPPPAAPPQRSAAELEKLAAPIALHPDPLISILLPAAAYPVEIVQAARFVKDTNNIPKIDAQPWDDNVKAVAKFPELISKMDADLQWTVDLGVAFVEQPKELMDKIQELRAKAHKAGTLQTTPQQLVSVTNVVVLQTNVTQVVTVTNQVVQVQPSNPEVIYVPTYPPTVYYPPPGYVYDPLAPLVSFGVGLAVGAIIANNCDWYGGAIWVGGGGIWVGGGGWGDVDVDIDIDEINIDRGDRVDPRSGDRSRGPSATQQKWQPDQNRLRTSGAPASAQTREARGWGSASTQPAQRGGATASTRPATPAAGARPAAQPTYNFSERPAATGQQARSDIMNQGAAARQQGATARGGSTSRGSSAGPAPSNNRSTSGSASAFGGVSNRSSAREASHRGSYSRGGGRMGGGGGGGRGGGRR